MVRGYGRGTKAALESGRGVVESGRPTLIVSTGGECSATDGGGEPAPGSSQGRTGERPSPELFENREIVARPGELREPTARVTVRAVKRPFRSREVTGRRFPLLAALGTAQPNTGLVHTPSEDHPIKSVTPLHSGTENRLAVRRLASLPTGGPDDQIAE